MSELLKTIAAVNGTITAQNGVLTLESGQTIDLSEYLPAEEKLTCDGERGCKQPVTYVLNTIKAGDRVTILIPSGTIRIGRTLEQYYYGKTGRAVMRGPHGWVLNMGGRHGTPAIATSQNIVRINQRRSK